MAQVSTTQYNIEALLKRIIRALDRMVKKP